MILEALERAFKLVCRVSGELVAALVRRRINPARLPLLADLLREAADVLDSVKPQP